ncbi:MAG: CdaR family protein [Clostridia bacterium]|nr:CdaR family protein [Clostridia bacterium]
MEKNTTLKIVSLLCAILLWSFVVSVVNPPTTTTIRGVPVTLTDGDVLKQSRLAIAGDGVYTVDVVLAGSRNDVAGVTAADITATASLAGLTPGQSYLTVNVTAPPSTSVSEIRTERIQVYVDEYISEEKPVRLVSENVKSGYEVSVLNMDAESYKVSGAKSLVEMVSALKVTLDASGVGVDEDAEFVLNLHPVDSEGNAVKGVEIESDKLALVATLHTVKTVPLYSLVEGTPGLGASVQSSNIPATINIKGTLAALSRVSYIECEPIKVDGITEDSVMDVVPIFPEGISPAEGSKNLKANITLADSGSLSLKLSTKNAEIKGLADNLDADVDVINVNAVVQGSLLVIKNLNPEEVVITLDLSGLGAGTYDVPIGARSTEGKEFTITADPETVSVTIESAE